MEVENYPEWKETNIGGTHFPLPWLSEEGYIQTSAFLKNQRNSSVEVSASCARLVATKLNGRSNPVQGSSSLLLAEWPTTPKPTQKTHKEEQPQPVANLFHGSPAQPNSARLSHSLWHFHVGHSPFGTPGRGGRWDSKGSWSTKTNDKWEWRSPSTYFPGFCSHQMRGSIERMMRGPLFWGQDL